MILSELKKYIKDHHAVNLYELTLHFNTDENAMQDMLEHWIRKGKVKIIDSGHSGCSDCKQCKNQTKIFQWIED